MNKFINFKSLVPHILVVVFFAIISVLYMSPILDGKGMMQSDTSQMHAVQSEIRKFETENPGQYTGWTNSMFGGMPTYFVGGNYSQSIFYKAQSFIYNLFTQDGTYLFLYLLGAYILLMCLGVNLISSVLAAIGYAFFSYNLLIIEAGHIAKVYALAFSPIMLGGLVLAFKNKPWAGAALFSLGLGLELNANHYQITYYSAFVLLVFGIFELVRAIKSKTLTSFLLAAGLCLILGFTVILTNTSRIWTTMDYTKETARGGSELKSTDVNKTIGGLDKDYAFEWSYGKLESLTFLIPNFSGGSGGELNEKSKSFEVLSSLGITGDQASQFVKSLPTYWGDQRFVSGTTYSGAIICFLFVLGLFFADKRYKTPFLVSAVLCLFISWGSNFSILNNLLFDYLPMFNKFRAVSMILSIFQMCLIVIAGLGLHQILTNPPTWAEFKKPLLISFTATAGLSLILSVLPSLFGFVGANDPQLIDSLKQSFGQNQSAVDSLYNALLKDRAALMTSDALRSFFLILISAGILLALVFNKLKNKNIVGGLIVLLVLIDLWSLDKRYLNANDFQTKPVSRAAEFVETALDQQILQDKSLSYRVIDVTSSPFTNALTSAFHKSLGGYSAAKLSRFVDIYDRQIAKNNMAIYNMFNVKYFIAPTQGGTPAVQLNSEALGNAWFVSEIKMVNGADAEMQALDSLKPAKTVIIDEKFNAELNGAKPANDLTGTIKLTNYQPNKLEYDFDSPNSQVVVFSEVFYKGNQDWISTIDGKESKHFRANYILRGMAIPAGKHKIEFKFDPVSIKSGQKYDRNASFAWIALMLGCLFMNFKATNNKKDEPKD
jgi:hypothetical protein